jgi:hypothetical protein
MLDLFLETDLAFLKENGSRRCPKSHTERLKTEYIAAIEANTNNPIFNRFQIEYESNIFAFVDECDRRVRAAHRKLEKTPEENAKTTNLVREAEPYHCLANFPLLIFCHRDR